MLILWGQTGEITHTLGDSHIFVNKVYIKLSSNTSTTRLTISNDKRYSILNNYICHAYQVLIISIEVNFERASGEYWIILYLLLSTQFDCLKALLHGFNALYCEGILQNNLIYGIRFGLL